MDLCKELASTVNSLLIAANVASDPWLWLPVEGAMKVYRSPKFMQRIISDAIG